jgi:ankyrin repeat protein
VAAAGGAEELVERLLKEGVPVDIEGAGGYTPLAAAAEAGKDDVVDILLDARADPNREVGYQRLTPLMLAAKACKDGPIADLRFKGARLDYQASDGTTALMLAAECSNSSVASALMSAGARDDRQDDSGRTALMRAAARGHQSTVGSILFSGHPKIDRRDRDGRSALDHARRGKHQEVVDKLIAAGARE